MHPMHLTTLWSRLATSAAALLFLLGVGMFTAAASAQGAGPDALVQPPETGVLVLSKSNPLVDPSSAGRAWVDGQATLGITDVAALARAAKSPFMPQESGTVYQSGANKPLWLHYRLRTESGGETEWLFEIPVTLIDAVTFFQRGKTGAWVSQSAGDTIAVSSWPELGRYPAFTLIFLPVRHAIFSFELTTGRPCRRRCAWSPMARTTTEQNPKRCCLA